MEEKEAGTQPRALPLPPDAPGAAPQQREPEREEPVVTYPRGLGAGPGQKAGR